MDCSIKDFQLVNRWCVDTDGEKFDCCNNHRGNPKFIIDMHTGKKYINDSIESIRFKCFLMTFGTPFVHIPCGAVNIAYRVLKLVLGYHFWPDSGENENPTSCSDKFLEFSKDGLRIISQPFSIIGLEMASFYGIINPYDGRKLYASIERVQYGNGIMAPCFQPNPKGHLLGGNINARDEY